MDKNMDKFEIKSGGGYKLGDFQKLTLAMKAAKGVSGKDRITVLVLLQGKEVASFTNGRRTVKIHGALGC